MAKVITITYDEQRDAIAAGYDSHVKFLHTGGLVEGEHAEVTGGRWMLVMDGEPVVASPRMARHLDALLGFMERTKDT